jgi:large subunit ribosomal protein L12
MEYMYALLLLHEAGKEITRETIVAILKSIQLEPDEAILTTIMETLPTMSIGDLLRTQVTLSPSAIATPKEIVPTEEQPKPAEESVGLSKLFG